MREYFNFTVAYAKLHLLLGACLDDQGKLVLAVYCQVRVRVRVRVRARARVRVRVRG